MSPDGMSVRPVPTEEEAAAIAAALVVTLAGGGDDEEPTPTDPRWRFSGRWWNRPMPMGRPRP